MAANREEHQGQEMRYEKRKFAKHIKSVMGYRWKIKGSKFGAYAIVKMPDQYQIEESGFWFNREDYLWMLNARREGAFPW